MVLTAFGRPLEMRSFPLPRLAEGQVLVRLAASGVCGSDLHIWQGHDPRIELPLIPGHEALGWVVDTGGTRRSMQAEPLKPGELIAWDRGVTCGECYFCVQKRYPSLCPNRKVYGITMPCSQPPFLLGGYADHMVLHPKTKLLKLPQNADPVVLVPTTCSGATAAHAIATSGIVEGDTVLVIGPGTLGLFAMALANERRPAHIIAFGTKKHRLDTAMKFGATHTANVNETTPAQRHEMVMSLTDGRGADVVIDASGKGETAAEGISLCTRGGTYSLPGVAVPVGEIPVRFYEDVSRRNLRIQGVWVSDQTHLQTAIELVLAGRYPFGDLITHRVRLEEANDALAALARREVLKAVILPEKA
jgi:threonine dehydrogenase-like Zn-dependent dehydrogenase